MGQKKLKKTKPLKPGGKKLQTKSNTKNPVSRLAPSLTRGLFVIYHAPTDSVFLKDSMVFLPASGNLARSATYVSKTNAQHALNELKDDYRLGVNSCAEFENAEVTELGAIAHTHYELSAEGHMKMELRNIYEDATPYVAAKKMARDRLMDRIKKEKDQLRSMVKEFERQRTEQVKKILDAEKTVEKFDARSMHGKANG